MGVAVGVSPSGGVAVGVGVGVGVSPSGGIAVGVGVTTTTDNIEEIDVDPGDGVCLTAQGQCKLRAAVQESNALPGHQTIQLPAGEYPLKAPGYRENSIVGHPAHLVYGAILVISYEPGRRSPGGFRRLPGSRSV